MERCGQVVPVLHPENPRCNLGAGHAGSHQAEVTATGEAFEWDRSWDGQAIQPELSGLWAITATVTEQREGGWTAIRQVPTFYLDENVQGFLDEDGARRVARRVIDPFNTLALTVTAVKL